jgi:hypothetical protein
MNELDEYIQTLEADIKGLEDQALEKHGYTPAMMQKLVIDIQNLEYDEEKLREKLVLDCERRFISAAESDVEQLRGYMQAQLECNGGVAWHVADDIKHTKSAINIISETMKVFG